MNNEKKYIPVNCWNCGTMNNFVLTKSCVKCNRYLKLSENRENGSNLHSDSILDNPVAKSTLIAAGIFVVFLTAGLLLNKGLPSSLDNLLDFSTSGEKTGDKSDASSVKKNLFADKLNKTYVPLKKGNLSSSSWYKNSWWSYVRKYPTIRQIFEKNREASGKMLTGEDIQSVYLTANISAATTRCFDAYCENNVIDPNTYSNPTLSFDTLNDYLNKSYIKVGEAQVFVDKSGKFFRIAKTSNAEASQIKNVQVKEVFNGLDAWKQTITYDADGANPVENFEKLDYEKTNALKKEMQAILKNSSFDNDAEVLGIADVGEGTSFVVKSKEQDKTLYFDTVSGLMTREDKDDLTIFFADFRMLNESMTPYLIYFRKGLPSHDTFSWIRLEVSEWKLNSEQDNSIFTKPEK